MELVNKIDQPVAIKVKTTNPKKYSVRPASGIVLPRGSSVSQLPCKRRRRSLQITTARTSFSFRALQWRMGQLRRTLSLTWSILVAPEFMKFSKAPGKVVEEFKLRVVYVPANPPSPVPEEAEEENESLDSDVDQAVERPSTPNAASGHVYTSGSQASHDEDVSMIRKSEEEESRYGDENKKLQEELELLRKRVPSRAGFSAAFVLLVFLLSLLVGYLMLESKA